MSEQTDPLRTFVAAMRRPGGEAQWTQMISAFARTDQVFASGLVKAVVGAAPRRPQVEQLGQIPDELRCTDETPVVDTSGEPQGRVDLLFEDDIGEFALLVELKLHSGFGHKQLNRYLKALDALPVERSALLAVTSHVPLHGEEDARLDDRFLGSARWAGAIEAMSGLRHSDDQLNRLWQASLQVLREEGDLGMIDPDPDAIRAWSHYSEGRKNIIGLLEEIAEPAVDIVRQELADAKGVPASDELADIDKSKSRIVTPWLNHFHVKINVPAGGPERIWIKFTGEGRLCFTAEAHHSDEKLIQSSNEATVDATEKLRAQGFEMGRWWGTYWSRRHEPEEWIDAGAEMTSRLIDFVREDVRALVQSGLIASLEHADAGSSSPPPSEEDEDPAGSTSRSS